MVSAIEAPWLVDGARVTLRAPAPARRVALDPPASCGETRAGLERAGRKMCFVAHHGCPFVLEKEGVLTLLRDLLGDVGACDENDDPWELARPLAMVRRHARATRRALSLDARGSPASPISRAHAHLSVSRPHAPRHAPHAHLSISRPHAHLSISRPHAHLSMS